MALPAHGECRHARSRPVQASARPCRSGRTQAEGDAAHCDECRQSWRHGPCTAMSSFARRSAYLFNIAIDDEDHTAEWLRRGQVIAAVSSLEKPVQGCRRTVPRRAALSCNGEPDFVSRHFPQGVTAEAIGNAPALTFNQKDRLQSRWIRQVLGEDLSPPTHWLPSTQASSKPAFPAWDGA